jgi:anaerobic magnesium-protoporphyrin IX monomethyl ester cyclase
MSAIFINPQLVVQSNDKFTTGIVYMPITLAYVISNFKKNNIKTNLIDLYGKNPTQCFKEDNHLIFGDKIENIHENEFTGVDCIYINANQVGNHISILRIIKFLKKKYKGIPITILENSQAVTAYSLVKIKEEFFNLGCDFILIGDLEYISVELHNNLKKIDYLKNLNGIITKNFCNDKINFVENLDDLSFPAWEDFPLENYWKLGYSHGPLSNNKYLPILGSRGCPYPCNFCVVPKTNERKWRSRTPESIVKELEYFKKNLKVEEFHFEDLNPTVNDTRTKDLCNLIVERNIQIKWKIVAGTKVESIKDFETVKLLKNSGCNYISISPESGSQELMKSINKPFNYNHALKIIKEMKKNKIFSQACFIIGYPGETKKDLNKTRKMIFSLTKIGIDEIAVFIITPIPGSQIYETFGGFSSLSNLTFSPIWRDDYKKLNRERLIMYSIFLMTKFIFHPLKIIKQIRSFFTKNFNTKMEMVPYKVLKLRSFENNAKK